MTAAQHRKHRTRTIAKALIAFNMLLIAGAVFIVAYTSLGPGHKDNSRQELPGVGGHGALDNQPIDLLSSTDIAASLARMSDMDMAEIISYQAEVNRQSLSSISDNIATTGKPLIVETDLRSRFDIIRHTTVEGDTVNELARRYNVTSNSIRWSNSLGGINVLRPGTELLIPPINGVVYFVRASDTPESLARRFGSNAEQIIAFNDAEISGLPVGQYIVIPDGQLQVIRNFGYRSTVYGSSGLCGREGAAAVRRVTRGSQLGFMGTTGRSTGVHLHLAMCDSAGGSYMDPNVGICQRGISILSSSCDIKYGFSWPVPSRGSYYISRGFTGYHRGLDIVGNSSVPIIAVADGDIIGCGWMGAGGNTVVVRHDNGIVSTYMHLSRLNC